MQGKYKMLFTFIGVHVILYLRKSRHFSYMPIAILLGFHHPAFRQYSKYLLFIRIFTKGRILPMQNKDATVVIQYNMTNDYMFRYILQQNEKVLRGTAQPWNAGEERV